MNIKLLKQSDIGIYYEIFGLRDFHKFYHNYQQQIYFLNIPKNASTFMNNQLKFMVNESDFKISFSLIRDPYERFISFIMYSGIEKSEKNISILLDAFATQNQKTIHNILQNEEVNFTPQSFYFHNIPDSWKPVGYIWTLESLKHFIDVLKYMEIQTNSINFSSNNVSKKNTDIESFIKNLIENDYNDWFNSFYDDDFELYNKAKSNEGNLFNNFG